MTLTNSDFPTDPHGWAQLLPERNPCPPLTGHHHVPFVVIGAGVTGLACARRLAGLHSDQEIWLVDARLVAQGASGRNSGFAVAFTHVTGGYKEDQKHEYHRVNRINKSGLALLRQCVRENKIDCQWNDSGYYHCAADQHAISERQLFVRYLEQMETPHTLLEANELNALLGTNLYQTGIHVGENALMQPASLVQGLADSLPANVKLIEQNPVLKIDHGTSLTLHLKNATIVADKLLLATNHEIVKLGLLSRRVIGSTLSGSFTRTLSDQEMVSLGTLDQWGILSLHGGGATLRLTKDKRLCIRNTAEYHGAKLLSERDLAERAKIHRAAFENRFPQLSHVPFEYSWSCVEGISANNTSFFGKQSDNVWFAGGYNGSGVSKGTAFGHALAEYASGGQSQLITDCLANPKAKYLPPRPLLDIGAWFSVRKRFKGVGLDR